MSDTTAIQIPRCHICGCSPPHGPAACPLVESVEYHANGAVAKITKRQPMQTTTTFAVSAGSDGEDRPDE